MKHRSFLNHLIAPFCLLILYGCAHSPEDPLQDLFNLETPVALTTEQANRPLKGQYTKVSWDTLPGWSTQSTKDLEQVLRQNCRAIERPTPIKKTHNTRVSTQAWRSFCRLLAQTPSLENPIPFLQHYLDPWFVHGTGKTTGYYIPVVKGSLHQAGTYQWPLLGTPTDLITLDPTPHHASLKNYKYKARLLNGKWVPYYTRAYINAHQNQPPFKALVWLEDPIEAFFLQVQGSGYVQLPDGQHILLAYDNHNGHPYVSIGKYLLETHQITPAQASMQGIKAWAKKHNKQTVLNVINKNPALPFFKIKYHSTIIGAYGISLTTERSAAVDPNYIPLGSPLFINSLGRHKIQRTVFAHDTGSAIKGPSRIDYFWGIGPIAGEKAGQTNQDNQIWILWPKEAGKPSGQ